MISTDIVRTQLIIVNILLYFCLSNMAKSLHISLVFKHFYSETSLQIIRLFAYDFILLIFFIETLSAAILTAKAKELISAH